MEPLMNLVLPISLVRELANAQYPDLTPKQRDQFLAAIRAATPVPEVPPLPDEDAEAILALMRRRKQNGVPDTWAEGAMTKTLMSYVPESHRARNAMARLEKLGLVEVSGTEMFADSPMTIYIAVDKE